MKLELSYDDFWLVREALDKRIEQFKEHIEYMRTCAKEIEEGGAVPLIGRGEQGARVVRDVIENFEAQIRKHNWLMDVPFSQDAPALDMDGDEDE